MLEVRYEDLVDDLAGQARRLVAHCGIEWDERCLAFHETKRPVHTASLVQVRKSIYGSSVGRSRFYGSRLQPLMDALGVDDRSLQECDTERNSRRAKNGGRTDARRRNTSSDRSGKPQG